VDTVRERKTERLALPEGPSEQKPFYRMTETDPVSRVCGCETWSVTLRDEHRIKVFENRVPGGYLDLREPR